MSTKAYKPDYKSRLEAQKHRLESRSEESKMRILNNVDYLRTDGVEVAKEEALRALADKSPMTAKLVGSALGIKAPAATPRTRIIRMDPDEEGRLHERSHLVDLRQGQASDKPSIVDKIKDASRSSLIQEVILPAGLAVGSSLLLAGTLRGAGSGLRGIAKGILKGIGKGVFKL